jgi:endonuclease/exonuclease/phosphatase family metal-dependent hydrolase
MAYRVFFSNIGYARGIDGTLWQHIARAHRHIYSGLSMQQQVLGQLKTIIATENPDLCCLVEVDRGSFHSGCYNQMQSLLDDDYCVHEIADKYGENSWLAKMPLFKGKSNAFLSKKQLPFQRLYFRRGSKRLIYRLELPGNITLFFAHFALSEKVRADQMDEMRNLIQACTGEVMILADFNIMKGFGELKPLLHGTGLEVLNGENDYTFTFHRRRLVLDLCLCSTSLVNRMDLRVIPQPFSDHAALLVDIKDI